MLVRIRNIKSREKFYFGHADFKVLMGPPCAKVKQTADLWL